MTRSTGSVPEGRIRMRPFCSSASSISCLQARKVSFWAKVFLVCSLTLTLTTTCGKRSIREAMRDRNICFS